MYNKGRNCNKVVKTNHLNLCYDINIVTGVFSWQGLEMKVFEIFGHMGNDDGPQIDFDLHDDVMFFMRNDPEFYRKEYYPFVSKFERHTKNGGSAGPAAFKKLVNVGYKQYYSKFPSDGLEDTLEPEDVQEICKKLHAEELEHIRKSHKGKEEN